jgi:hypothetical protein
VDLDRRRRHFDRGNGCDIDPFDPDAAPLVGEVKARGNSEGFVLLEQWLGDADMLRSDRAEPLVVLWRLWARLLKFWSFWIRS